MCRSNRTENTVFGWKPIAKWDNIFNSELISYNLIGCAVFKEKKENVYFGHNEYTGND